MHMLTRPLLYPGITVISLVVSWLIMVWVNPVLTGRLLSEDHLVEWLQVSALILVALFCVGVARGTRDRVVQTIFVLLGVLAVVVIGEELSWGQRLLGFDTPGSIASWNLQGELNFHGHRFFATHQWVVTVLLGLLGLALIHVGRGERRHRFERLSSLAPPRSFRLAFLVVLILGVLGGLRYRGIAWINDMFLFPDRHNYLEVRELAIAFVVLAYAYWARSSPRPGAHPVSASTTAGGGNKPGDAEWVAIPGLVLSLGLLSMLGLAALDALALRHGAVHRSQTYAVYHDRRGPIRHHAVHFVNFSCDASDTAGRFFVHSFPVYSGDLPPVFVERGFHNMDFVFADYGWRMFGVCWLRVDLPDYPITTLRFGQYMPDPSGRLDHIWGGEHNVIHP